MFCIALFFLISSFHRLMLNNNKKESRSTYHLVIINLRNRSNHGIYNDDRGPISIKYQSARIGHGERLSLYLVLAEQAHRICSVLRGGIWLLFLMPPPLFSDWGTGTWTSNGLYCSGVWGDCISYEFWWSCHAQ